MLDILLQGLAVVAGGLIGGVAGYFIGKAISEYVEKAKGWFSSVWHQLSRVYRGAGILVRHGNRLFKRFIAQLTDGEIEEYEERGDNGVEVDLDDLSEEAKKELLEDGYIVASVYE